MELILKQILEKTKNLSDYELEEVLTNVKIRMCIKNIFKGGVIERNPENRRKALKRYFKFMISLHKKKL
ncbi:hypothetical protein FDB64_02040 [Clostridium botulinum]|nr:hypothetical protein [Clostridium botulinum]NFM03687.1 hypothetical protein [Clostridium botulinum]